MKELNLIQKEQKSLNVSVMLDTKGFFEKPKVNMVGSISNRISGNQADLKVEELAKEITLPDAKTWMPAIMKGKRLNENWKSQQVVALDFDGGYPFEEALKRLEEYGLSCTFAYNTFSAKQKEKFRIVLVLDEVIRDRELMKAIIENFKLLFPEADQSATDLSRMFYGGKEIIFVNYDYQLSVDLLENSITIYQLSFCSNPKAVDRCLNKLSKKRNPIYKYYRNAKKRHIETKRNFDWEKAIDNIKIVSDFFEGKWLHHEQLFGLATNFFYIEGGLLKMKEQMEKVGMYNTNNFNIIKSVRKYKYENPQLLKNFSPYEEDHKYNSVLDATNIPDGYVNVFQEYEGRPANEIYNSLVNTMKEIYENPSPGIHVICAPTGIGKTECYTKQNSRDYAKLGGMTVAFPTHELLNEVESRFDTNCKIVKTPKLPEFSKLFKSEIDYCYKVGAPNKAYECIVDVAEGSNTYDFTISDMNLAQDYLKNLQNANYSNDYDDMIFMTTHHSKHVFLKHELILFDEDPLRNRILTTGYTTKNDLDRLKNSTLSSVDAIMTNELYKEIACTPPNIPKETPEIVLQDYESIIEKVVSNKEYESGILDFINSDYYMVDPKVAGKIHFLTRNDLPDNKKIIILSATANEWIYKNLFKDRVTFHDFGNAEIVGKVIQDTSRRYSRQNFNIDKSVLEYCKINAENRKVITFKNLKSRFTNACDDIHFGNLEGYDNLKGEKIAVIGTPHFHPSIYYLYSKALGIELKPKDFRPAYLNVEHDGMQFNFQTYEREELRKIQFHFIESEIRQAVGRGRPTREVNADILLMCAFPLKEFNQLYRL